MSWWEDGRACICYNFYIYLDLVLCSVLSEILHCLLRVAKVKLLDLCVCVCVLDQIHAVVVCLLTIVGGESLGRL